LPAQMKKWFEIDIIRLDSQTYQAHYMVDGVEHISHGRSEEEVEKMAFIMYCHVRFGVKEFQF
jgi:hypothetical protein